MHLGSKQEAAKTSENVLASLQGFFPESKLCPFEAHVCDEVRLDGAIISSIDHWGAFLAALTQNIGTNDKQRKVPWESAKGIGTEENGKLENQLGMSKFS